MSRRAARLALVAVLVLAAGFLVAGGRIYVKAWLAQRLLHRAWAETRAGARAVKPWPWADTWPVARLAVPRHGVDLIVLADASGRSLAFGPGQVPGSAPPGAGGHTVLSGHRDTQFRFLKDLSPGDEVRVETPDGRTDVFVVSAMGVIDARGGGDAGRFAWDTEAPGLTLLTCFPFDAVVPGGPLRYVVRADPRGRAPDGGYAAPSPASPPKSPPLPESLGWPAPKSPP